MDMRKWFKEAQYGMMVHWGLYSLLAGEYKDRYSGVYAEWIQANLAIPNAEYGKLAKAFNPVFFDAEAVSYTHLDVYKRQVLGEEKALVPQSSIYLKAVPASLYMFQEETKDRCFAFPLPSH